MGGGGGGPLFYSHKMVPYLESETVIFDVRIFSVRITRI